MSDENAPVSKPCIQARGPMDATIMIVGEAPGETEEQQRLPFVGSSGQELGRMLSEAGIDPEGVRMTNVLWTRPPGNKLDSFLLDPKTYLSKQPLLPPSGQSSALGALLRSPLRKSPGTRYLHPNFWPELDRLYREIAEVNPNLILALGNTALWATTGQTAISKYRGTILPGLPQRSQEDTTQGGFKVLPTFHPASVLRQWDQRVIVVADLIKASRQAQFPELRRPSRTILVHPSLADISDWMRTELTSARHLAIDVETRLGQITEIGFAARADNALVIPFILGHNQNYWPSLDDECAAWELVAAICDHPIAKVFQNGLYDLQYIYKVYGIRVRNCVHDTMLKHHSLYPEMNKGLGFLGSIYTEEPAWKILRTRNKDSEKRDDE